MLGYNKTNTSPSTSANTYDPTTQTTLEFLSPSLSPLAAPS